MSSMREKLEMQLAEHVKKAIHPIETAPKQKHVRWCILFTWERKSCMEFWSCLKLQPNLADEISSYKALIVIHKILMGGPPIVLAQSYGEKQFFDLCNRYFSNNTPYGYSNLIRAYVSFLREKLEFHKIFKEFTGNFDFECYSAAKSIKDVNEGFQISCELMDLQDKLELFYKQILNTFGGSANECKISSLVPIVEESYGIYNFMTSFLSMLFSSCEYVEPLFPLQERYIKQFYALKKFYEDCSRIQYLTSLINIPCLPDIPPISFENLSANRKMQPQQALLQSQPQPLQQLQLQSVKPITTNPSSQVSTGNLINISEFSCSNHSSNLSISNGSNERIYEEYMRELHSYKIQIQRDQMIISHYSNRISEMEKAMHQLNEQLNLKGYQDDSLLKSLQEQINMWKNKYEAILEMYNTLKTEHFQLLSKYKDEMAKPPQITPEQLNKLKEEINRLTTEKRGIVIELEKEKEKNQLELNKARKELIDAKTGKIDLADSLQKENSLKEKLDQITEEKWKISDELKRTKEKLNLLNADADKYDQMLCKLTDKEHEFGNLQQEMNALSIKLSQSEKSFKTDEESLIQSFNEQFKGREEIFKNILIQSFCSRISESLDDYKNASVSGNTLANVKISLALLETVYSITQECNSKYFFISTSIDDYEEFINVMGNLCHFFDASISAIKGSLSNFVQSTNLIYSEFSTVVCKFGCLIIENFKGINSKESIETVFIQLINLTKSLDEQQESLENDIENMADFVSTEITMFDKMVSEATEQLKSLKYNVSISLDLSCSSTNSVQNVNKTILEGAIAITNAITNLIKCASYSQQEIVRKGKGSGSADAFYKRHHRWTEGLVSAAKTVAVSTKFLVDVADGVIKEERTMDELIIASREVAASTAQLVAAARVKASRDSKAQWNLEDSAKAVSEATRLLVEAVENIRELMSSENQTKSKHLEDLSALTHQQYKVQEMNQQIKILGLEKSLSDARRDLSEMRRAGYHKETI